MKNEEDLKSELKLQKEIAYIAGFLQGDVTVKTLLESLAEGVVFINDSARIILINNRLSELTGYDKFEVIGESLNIFIPDELEKRHKKHIHNYFTQPKIRPMGIGMELIAKRKDGSTFPVEISISYLDTDSGRLGIGFVTDITDRKKAENELKEKNIELDAYAHTVAHDLSSSLLGIMGYSELLIESGKEISEEKRDSYLNQINVSSKKMDTIIRELLVFASIKKEDVEIKKVNMKELIESARQRLRYQIDQKEAQLKVSDNMLDCLGYPLWIEEIWYNLISNAVKYGGDKPEIEIYCTQAEDGFIKYSVKDGGEGISEELKLVIFNDRDAEKDKLSKGLGLGLSIVRRITDKLNGRLTVESEEGKGSIFSFYLKH